MGSDHKHDHSTKNIKTVFFLNLGFTIFELVGGFYVNSVAIMSDAIHDMGDSISLGTSWYLQEKSKKAATKQFTFGYRRFSLLGALINSVILIVGSVFIVSEAVKRIIEPEHSDANGMMIFAIIGIAVNSYAAWKMSSGKSLNERVVSLHLMEDVLGWVAVLIVSIVLQFKDIQYLDPILSLLITAYILWNVIKRLRETIFLFLQGHPVDIDRDAIESEIMDIAYITKINDMHIWSLDGEHHVLTAQVFVDENIDFKQLLTIKKQLNKVLKKYPFEHYTVETEVESNR